MPYKGVPVGTIKRHAAGKGNADKAAMVAAVRARGFSPADDKLGTPMPYCSWFSPLRVDMWWKTNTIEGRTLLGAG